MQKFGRFDFVPELRWRAPRSFSALALFTHLGGLIMSVLRSAVASQRSRPHALRLGLGGLMLSATLLACGNTPPAAPNSTLQAASAAAPTKADLLHVVLTPEPGHTISFDEDRAGEVRVVEAGHVDRHRPLLDASRAHVTSLPDLYRQLAPGTEVPAAFVEAESRRATFERQQEEAFKTATQHEADIVLSDARGDRAPMDARATLNNASFYWDWNADAQWFLENFCKTNTEEFCPTNTLSAWTSKSKSVKYEKYEVTGMNASHQAGAWMETQHYDCVGWSCSWRQSWAGHIPPREYRTLLYTTKLARYARILSYDNLPDPRVHLAVNRIRVGQPTPPNIWAQAQPGNKFRVTGDSFKANTKVYLIFKNWYGQVYREVMSNSSGKFDITVTVSCDVNTAVGVYAHDGRTSSSTVTGLLESNNVQLTCK